MSHLVYLQRKKKKRKGTKRGGRIKKKLKWYFYLIKKEVSVDAGMNLLDAAREAGIRLNASCNGAGACGKCKLIIKKRQGRDKSNGSAHRKRKTNGLCACLSDNSC